MRPVRRFTQDASEVVDYWPDFRRLLQPYGDTIASVSVTADDGLNVGTVTVRDDTTLSVVVFGGEAGRNYTVTVTVTTANGNTLVRTFAVLVRD